MSAKVCVFSNGCPENRLDAARIQDCLLENGWELTNNVKKADLIIFNSCGQQASGLLKKRVVPSIEMIKEIKKIKKPSAQLIICGCLPKTYPEPLKKIHQGIVIGPDEFERFKEIFQLKENKGSAQSHFLLARKTTVNKVDLTYLRTFFEIPLKSKILFSIILKKYCKLSRYINVYDRKTYLIKVSTGCISKCTFCSIRNARGKLKSKSIKEISEEFKMGLSMGYTEFGLIGTDVGSYGRDKGMTLVHLLQELVMIKGNYNIKLRNVQPRFLIEMLPDLEEIFKTKKITYIESSAESGNDRILKLMNRGYTIDDYKKVIRLIKQKFPFMQIRTQLLVGFPSETEGEFQDTLCLLDELPFDFIEIYKFRPEPRTKAALMDDQLPRKVIERRSYQLYKKFYFRKK